MLGIQAKYVTGITDDEYNDSSFTHPTYTDENGDLLKIRYAEIAILRQRTPGRLDNVPIGYPDFDSTPDGVTTSVGPLPSAPYTDFTANGSTASSITISAGGTVYFGDTSVKTPPQYGPTGWNWNFGSTASPTGSTAQNIMVTYGTTGTYTVTLTASNATGSTTKTKINLITVI
jgi:PKD repeat protein